MPFAHLEADAEWEGKGDEDYGPGYGGEHPSAQPDTVVAVISWNNKQHCNNSFNEGAMQMKGWWASNVNVWFRFMYSLKWNSLASLFRKQQNKNVLSPNFHIHIHVSVSDLFIPAGSVCLLC
jgi:hypothetical protein